MKLGRNDPCSCGSGKKYKHCCLGNESVSVVDLADRIWRQTREAIDGYAVAMLRFIEVSYGNDAVQGILSPAVSGEESGWVLWVEGDGVSCPIGGSVQVPAH
jgi:Predicted metal-binding protein related to the C-terminal domain of SecA